MKSIGISEKISEIRFFFHYQSSASAIQTLTGLALWKRILKPISHTFKTVLIIEKQNWNQMKPTQSIKFRNDLVNDLHHFSNCALCFNSCEEHLFLILGSCTLQAISCSIFWFPSFSVFLRSLLKEIKVVMLLHNEYTNVNMSFPTFF